VIKQLCYACLLALGMINGVFSDDTGTRARYNSDIDAAVSFRDVPTLSAPSPTSVAPSTFRIP